MSEDDALSAKEYEAIINRVSKQAANEFLEFRNAEKEKRIACCRYFKRGYAADLSHPELIDFLGISSPSILDLAGYREEEAQAVMDILSEITDAEIENTEI